MSFVKESKQFVDSSILKLIICLHIKGTYLIEWETYGGRIAQVKSSLKLDTMMYQYMKVDEGSLTVLVDIKRSLKV